MIGTVYLGRYEVVGALGRGSMGRVFLARQRDRDRLVVVKLMHPHIASDPKFRRLFRHEMQSMAKFRHPYAVSLYEGSLDGDPAGPGIVMEYVEGETLEQVRRRDGRLDLERA